MRDGKCRLCGVRGPVTPVMIPEDTTTNKLALLDLCAACREARSRPAR